MKKNSIPYLVLILLHVGLLIFTVIKKKDKKPFLVLFVGIGLSYIFEYFVLNIFRGYRYEPKVFKNNWVDTIFGAIISQSILVPIAGTTIATFRLGWWWKLGFISWFVLIERIFLHYKLFTHHWWKTTYTALFLPLFFWILKKWSILLEYGPNKWIANGTLFFSYWVNYMNIGFFLMAVFKQYLLKIGLVKNKYRETFILDPIYTFIKSMIATVTTRNPLLAVSILHILDRLLYKINLIKTKTWSAYFFIPFHIGMLFLGGKWYKQIHRNSGSVSPIKI